MNRRQSLWLARARCRFRQPNPEVNRTVFPSNMTLFMCGAVETFSVSKTERALVMSIQGSRPVPVRSAATLAVALLPAIFTAWGGVPEEAGNDVVVATTSAFTRVINVSTVDLHGYRPAGTNTCFSTDRIGMFRFAPCTISSVENAIF